MKIAIAGRNAIIWRYDRDHQGCAYHGKNLN